MKKNENKLLTLFESGPLLGAKEIKKKNVRERKKIKEYTTYLYISPAVIQYFLSVGYYNTRQIARK